MELVLGRALCKITLLPVTHVLVNQFTNFWMCLMTWNGLQLKKYKHTCDTIFTHFQGITNNIYGFGRPFFAPSVFYPYFYPSKWRVDGSLHKAIVLDIHVCVSCHVTQFHIKGPDKTCPQAEHQQTTILYNLSLHQITLFWFSLSVAKLRIEKRLILCCHTQQTVSSS